MSAAGGLRDFVDALGARLTRAGAAGERVALVCARCGAIERLDALHGFRRTDELREGIERAIRAEMLRPQDALEWLSRDELALVLQPMASNGVATLAVQKVMRLLASAVTNGGRAIGPQALAGAALYPQDGADAETLLRCAKAALRSARHARERWVLYRPQLLEGVPDTARYEERLPHAIVHNALALHYQPQIDLRTRRLVSAEALLRWHDKELGHVPAPLIVSAAESSSVMQELTRWVVNTAVRDCARLQRLRPGFAVSANVSPSNLREPDLASHVDLALRTWDLRARCLTLEVTETAMFTDLEAGIETLRDLKRYGVRVAMDDFGTGYSSMLRLARMPLDEIKIDLLFVRDMLEVPQHAKIVRSLIELAQQLEFQVVAEGVESEAVLSSLSHLGCERAQGYYIGKPMPLASLERLLAEGLQRGG